MITWELALVIVALTYMMVNVAALFIQFRLLNKMDGLLTKSYKFLEKLIDKSDKCVDELFEELEESKKENEL